MLAAQNAFRRYRPDVTAALRQGRNTIAILIRSATRVAAELAEAQPFPIPYAAQNSPIPHGNMLRKPACHFGWDWNLAIAPLGIYGGIALRPLRQARIEHVQTVQHHNDDGSVSVDVAVTLFGRSAGAAPLTIRFAGQERQVEAAIARWRERPHRALHLRSP